MNNNVNVNHVKQFFDPEYKLYGSVGYLISKTAVYTGKKVSGEKRR